MSDMPPSEESVVAAQQIPTIVQEVEVEEIPELEELPEGQDEFPREYVEKLRGENAKWRTRTRNIESSFDGYSPREQEKFLALASTLQNDPEAALEEFEAVTNRIRTQLGKESPVSEVNPDPVVEPDPTSAEPVVPVLTTDDIERLVGERLEADRQEQAKADDIQKTFAEAEDLDPSYKDYAAKAHLFAVAQQNKINLKEAHEIIVTGLEEVIDSAVEARLDDLAKGRVYPPRLPVGEAGNTQAKGPPKTLEEAKKAADARMDAAYRHLS